MKNLFAFLLFFVSSCSDGVVYSDDPVLFSEKFLSSYYQEKDIGKFRELLHPDLVSSLDSGSKRESRMWKFERLRVESWDIESISFVKVHESTKKISVEFNVFGKKDRVSSKTEKNIVFLKKHNGKWKVYALQ